MNQIILGDNLDVMRLMDGKSINLIYCDILYGTGKNFGDYVDLKPEFKIIRDFYEPRFVQMHRLLKSNGSIYLQMDIRINHWVRMMMDEIFGYENFRNEIAVHQNIGGRNKNEFAKKHDVIVVYSKSDDFVFNGDEIRIPYKSVISKKQDRPNVTPEKEEIGTIPSNVWDDIPCGMKVKRATDYFSEKHPKLLERIIKTSSNEGDLVADFFCGSGTTCVVAKELKRNYIGCDINKRAVQLTNERLNNINNINK